MGSCQSQCSSLLGRRLSEDELELNSNKNQKDNIPDPNGRSNNTVLQKTKKDSSSFQQQKQEERKNGKQVNINKRKNGENENNIEIISIKNEKSKDNKGKSVLKKETNYEGIEEIIPEQQRIQSNKHNEKEREDKYHEIEIKDENSKEQVKYNNISQYEGISKNEIQPPQQLIKDIDPKEYPRNVAVSFHSEKKIKTNTSQEENQLTNQEQLHIIQGKYPSPSTKETTNPSIHPDIIIPYRATINVFYGTQTGTSCEFAFDMASACEEKGFQVRVIHLEKFEPFMFGSCEIAMFFLASSGCMGGPTEDSHQFYLWLNSLNSKEFEVFKYMRYQVFSLFNSTQRAIVNTQVSQSNGQDHNHVNDNEQDSILQQEDDMQGLVLSKALNRKPTKIKSMGKRVDMILEEIGSCRVQDVCEVDSSKGEKQIKDLFKVFKEQLLQKLTESLKEKRMNQTQVFNQFLNFDMSFKDCIVTQSTAFQSQKFDTQSETIQNCYTEDLKWYLQSKEQIISKIKLFKSDKANEGMIIRTFENQQGISQECPKIEITQGILLQDYQLDCQEYMEIEIKLTKDQQVQLQQAQNHGIQVQFGNVVEIFPQNDSKIVHQMLEFIEISGETVIQSKPRWETSASNTYSEISTINIPMNITVREFIKDFVDLRAPIQANELFVLSKYVKIKRDKDILIDLCQFKNKDKLQQEQSPGGKLESLLRLLQSFEFEKIPIQIIACLDRIISPRVYFAGVVNQDKLLLTVRLHKEGLASKFLAEKEAEINSLKKEGYLRIRIRFGQRELSKEEENIIKNQNGSNLVPMLSNGSGRLQSAHSLMNSSSMKRFNNIFSSINSPCRVRLNSANLRIILICLDEGISAFRGYLEDIVQCKNRLKHEIHLFYGCRQLTSNRNEFLGEKNIRELHANKLIQTLLVASSPQQIPGHKNIIDSTIKTPNKSSSSIVSFLLERYIEKLCSLIENIDHEQTNLRVIIAGNQLMSQGVLGVIAKAYGQISKLSQFNAFNAVLNFETDGIITRITW